MRSFKSNENIHKKEGGSYYVVSANKASSVTLQSPGNESQKKPISPTSIEKNRIWIWKDVGFLFQKFCCCRFLSWFKYLLFASLSR